MFFFSILMLFYHVESKTSFFQDNETAAQPKEKVEEEVGGLDMCSYEEDLIDGFSFISFDTYEDMEVSKWLFMYTNLIFEISLLLC